MWLQSGSSSDSRSRSSLRSSSCLIDRLIYRYVAIKATRDRLLTIRDKVSFMTRQPDWGPGRVDTFNPYKAVQFNFPMNEIPDEEIVGITDLPSIWLQRRDTTSVCLSRVL